MEDGKRYYVIFVDVNKIKLASTRPRAGDSLALSLSDSTTNDSNHTFRDETGPTKDTLYLQVGDFHTNANTGNIKVKDTTINVSYKKTGVVQVITDNTEDDYDPITSVNMVGQGYSEATNVKTTALGTSSGSGLTVNITSINLSLIHI